MIQGTRRYSYDVFIELGTLHLGVKFPCKVGTIWESHMKTMQANAKPDLINGKVILNEMLSSNFTLEFDTFNKVFIPRSSTLKIVLYTQKGVREAGQLEFDLTTGLNKGFTEITLELPLQKCPDKHSKLSFTIKTLLKQELKNERANFVAGIMPDIIAPKSQSHLNALANENLKKKSKQQSELQRTPRNIPIPMTVPVPVPVPAPAPIQVIVSAPPVPSPEQIEIENFKIQRQALIAENINVSLLLTKAQFQIENLRAQLRRTLEQKQSMYGQIQSYTNQVDHLRYQNDQLRQVGEIYNEAEAQLITARTQLARIFNAATELGGPVLTDKLQAAIGIQENQL